jgi:hypothetical protein
MLACANPPRFGALTHRLHTLPFFVLLQVKA